MGNGFKKNMGGGTFLVKGKRFKVLSSMKDKQFFQEGSLIVY